MLDEIRRLLVILAIYSVGNKVYINDATPVQYCQKFGVILSLIDISLHILDETHVMKMITKVMK